MANLNVNDQVKFLTDYVINMFTNYVPNKIIMCKDKDPPWINSEIKLACKNKEKNYKHYVKHGRNIADQRNLYSLASYSAKLISDAKAKYFHNLGEKLNDPLIGAKTYWSILNKFMHKNKITLIPLKRTYLTNLIYSITFLQINA